MFLLSTHFLSNTFKSSVNWLVAVILNTFNWRSEKDNIFSYNFMHPLLSLCRLTIVSSRSCQQRGVMVPAIAKPV